MSDLFMSASQTLRDNLVTELQISNNFLRNKIGNLNKHPFYGYKIIIKQHMIDGNIFHETKGIFIENKEHKAFVLYKNRNNQYQMNNIFLKNIIISDDRIKQFDI